MKRGFTLIELLVVIAIISLLSSIVFGSVNESRVRVRNSKRVQDLIQVRNALELYKLANGNYPSPFGLPLNNKGVSCWDCFSDPPLIFGGPTVDVIDETRLAAIAPYLSQRPMDPKLNAPTPPATFTRGYFYKTDASGNDYKIALVGTVEGGTGTVGVDYVCPSGIPSAICDPNFWVTSGDPAISLASSELSQGWQFDTILSGAPPPPL